MEVDEFDDDADSGQLTLDLYFGSVPAVATDSPEPVDRPVATTCGARSAPRRGRRIRTGRPHDARSTRPSRPGSAPVTRHRRLPGITRRPASAAVRRRAREDVHAEGVCRRQRRVRPGSTGCRGPGIARRGTVPAHLIFVAANRPAPRLIRAVTEHVVGHSGSSAVRTCGCPGTLSSTMQELSVPALRSTSPDYRASRAVETDDFTPLVDIECRRVCVVGWENCHPVVLPHERTHVR